MRRWLTAGTLAILCTAAAQAGGEDLDSPVGALVECYRRALAAVEQQPKPRWATDWPPRHRLRRIALLGGPAGGCRVDLALVRERPLLDLEVIVIQRAQRSAAIVTPSPPSSGRAPSTDATYGASRR